MSASTFFDDKEFLRLGHSLPNTEAVRLGVTDRILFGEDSPEGVIVSNTRQMYVDTLTNELYINPDVGEKTGWLLTT